MRYIYALRNKSERQNKDLRLWNQEIKTAIKGYVGNSGNQLRNIWVKKDCFEFSVTNCFQKTELQTLGRWLPKISDFGFVRQFENVYAFVAEYKTDSEDEEIQVEFVNCNILSDALQEQIRASEVYASEQQNWVNLYNYIDVYSIMMSKEQCREIFGVSGNKEQIFAAKLYHRHVLRSEEEVSLEKSFFPLEHLYSAGEDPLEYSDFAKIFSVVKVSEEEEQQINQILEIDKEKEQIPEVNVEELFSDLKKGEYTFEVHNVGQGLATSLAHKNQIPFLYFDYGIAYNGNRKTLPKKIDIPIKEEGIVIVSHIDEDHWCGFRVNNDVLSCKWIVPDQIWKKGFNKLLASVKVAGGTIAINKNGFQYGAIKIGHDQSQINKLRRPKKVHEDGYAMYIDAKWLVDNTKCKIVVSGDQDYDYQDWNELCDVNILVACHHGGDYCWSKKGKVPVPKSGRNKIIYSYGNGNSYNHPSRVQKYKFANWNNEHHTPNGNYKLDIRIS